ncbi:MAG TPA: aldose 1-epimerase [Solirubrobacteraceae bacterium]|nr:aldose 1-epimerase [Solirubrobacteraceae bacterium]
MAAHEIGETAVEGHAVRVLRSPAGLEAAFAPGVGMIGCSLRHEGEELLGQRGGLAKYADTGSSMGIPLLHPWANRLDGLEYEAERVAVLLDPDRSPVRLDPNGLPIHGLVTASRYWEVTAADADADAATLSARLRFADHPELLAGFPFPHEMLVEVRLAGNVLALATTLRPTGEVAVPVAFGYHPYLRLPGEPREAWEITLPVRVHAELDDRGIPTGAAEEVSVPPGPLGDRVYDDLYPRLDDEPVFALEGAGRRLEVCFEQGYPVAQVYAPAAQEYICFEPMTAPTDALARGGRDLPRAEPGTQFTARFSIAVRGA